MLSKLRAAACVCVAAALALALLCAAQSDPTYDHQTTTYYPKHMPLTVEQVATVAAFFSPDYSINVLVDMINGATTTLDIATPGFSSWSGCTSWEGKCVGCDIEKQKSEAFPAFAAMLNAVHQRGVRVRLLTNNYEEDTCDGQIAPLDWLFLNHVDVRYYTTTTFIHLKYAASDGKRASVSSVNFSKTSFLQNREAGLIIYDDAPALLQFMTDVFEADFAQATPHVIKQQYSSSVLKIVQDTAAMPVVMPPQPSFHNAYVSPAPTPITAPVAMTVFASPDSARDELMADIGDVRESLQLMMYQVTDQGLCNALISLHQSKVNLTLLVSSRIFDDTDWKLAQACYKQMYDAGLAIRKTPSYYQYSHQKFWIVDGVRLGMSSGNWSPSDYPDANVFPPHTAAGWTIANRDLNIKTNATQVISVFARVLAEDFARGSDWHPF